MRLQGWKVKIKSGELFGKSVNGNDENCKVEIDMIEML